MKIFIDWKLIDSEEDFYKTFLPQVEAPEWHGHNLNALNDSIVNGGINGVEPPFCVINTGTECISPEFTSFYQSVISIFEDAKKEGRNVRVFKE